MYTVCIGIRLVAHMILIISPIVISTPSEGEEREGLVLTACACTNFLGNFCNNVRRPRARKSCMEQVYGTPSVSYTIWQVVILSTLQSSKEDGLLDRVGNLTLPYQPFKCRQKHHFPGIYRALVARSRHKASKLSVLLPHKHTHGLLCKS